MPRRSWQPFLQDQADQLDDPDLLDRASALERVLFSQDDDLLAEATRRQARGIPFFGVIYGHQLHVSIGQCLRDLELIALLGTAEDVRNQEIASKCALDYYEAYRADATRAPRRVQP